LNKIADFGSLKFGEKPSNQPIQQMIDMAGKYVVEQDIKEGQDLLDLKNRRRKGLLSTILSLNRSNQL